MTWDGDSPGAASLGCHLVTEIDCTVLSVSPIDCTPPGDMDSEVAKHL